MARFEVDINGRTRTITIERDGAQFLVQVDGRTRRVDAVRLDASTLSLLVDAESWTIGVTDAPDTGEQLVSVGGVTLRATLNGRRGRFGRRGHGAPDGRGTAGPQRITAPMPGKVVRVLIKPGDAVTARQAVIVVEAMKMENELRSPKDGVVAEVRVAEGTSVDAGSLLAVIE
jgi:biotin carboxyl carrier protein